MYRKMNHISRRMWKEQNDEERIDWNILPGRRVHIMKEKIIKLLDRADYRKLELIYRIVKKIVGAED